MFVCLGNICRSPLAEGVFRQLVLNRGLSDHIQCDSSGTSNYHIGDSPDPRTVENARSNGVILDHRAQQFDESFFDEFNYIVAMDKSNYRGINQHKTETPFGKVFMLRDYDNDSPGSDVPDPYYGGPESFQLVYEMINRSCENFLDYLIKEHDLT